MHRTPAVRTGLIISLVLAALDLVGLAGLGMDDAPPLAVVLSGGILGLLTVVAAVPAWRGSRPGLLGVVVTRAISGLLGFGVYFDSAAPTWAVVATSLFIVASIAAVWLLLPALRTAGRPVSV